VTRPGGVGPRDGRQLETAAFGGAKPPGAVGRSPRQGAWQAKPATSRCRAFCAASTHGRWSRPRGVGARHGRQLETAAFGGAKPPGAVNRSPRQGALQTKPATSSCRAFCAVSTHGRWPRPRAMGLGAAGSWKSRPSWGETAGAVNRSPRKGALQTKPATFSCRAFCAASTHERWPRPRACGPATAGVGNCGLREAKPPGAVGRSPRQGAWQMKPATSRCRAFCAASTHGRWARPGGVGPRDGRQLKTAAFGEAKPPGAVQCSPRQGAWQAKPATSSCRASCAASTHGRWPRPKGRWAPEAACS